MCLGARAGGLHLRGTPPPLRFSSAVKDLSENRAGLQRQPALGRSILRASLEESGRVTLLLGQSGGASGSEMNVTMAFSKQFLFPALSEK